MDQISDQEKNLHTTWGLGLGKDGAGYRDRLKRLCQFRLSLEPEEGRDTKQSDLASLQSSVDSWRQQRQGANADYIQKLKDLQNALRELERRVVNGQEETEEQYLARLARWEPKIEEIPGAATPACVSRQQALDRALAILGAVKTDGPASALRSLGDDLSSLEHDQVAGSCLARLRWRAMVREIIADWEWAYLQVLVRRAHECLTRNRLDARLSACAEDAAKCLAEAIEKLEHRGFSQPRTQGLYGLLAESFLLHAKAADVPSKKRMELIQVALTYARRAVEIDPENVNERRVLIEILSLLGDFEEVQAEAEVALNLDAGPETLRTIGASYWGQAASLRSREAHEKILEKAVSFFEKAKGHVESLPLDKTCPLEQIETHGWAHYWLGRFEGERGNFDKSTIHLRTAAELGFKPVESRVRLAWVYLEARAYDQADRAFRDSAAEAEMWETPAAQAPGEDQPIAELRFQTYLGRAFLALVAPGEPDSAGQSPPVSPNEPEKSITAAATYLNNSDSLKNKTDLQALLHEAWGRAHLGRRKPEEATRELEMAVRLSPRSSAYCHLAYARLEQAKAAGGDAEKRVLLEKAHEAHQLAVDMDPWGHQNRELCRLRCQLQLAKPSGSASAGQETGGAEEASTVN